MNPRHAVGIDLGTSNTVTAVVNAAGHTEIMRDSEGQWLIPSVVLFDDLRIVVGEEARLRGRTRPDRLAACAKRELGRPFYHQPIGGEFLAPELIQACILRHVDRRLLAALAQQYGIVIAVPAAFNDLQRRAVLEAAEMAGLPALGLVNETIAGALAFGENSQLFAARQLPTSGLLLMVLNLGGTSTEVSLVRVDAKGFHVLQTEFDANLGGNNWDRWLADYIADEVRTRHGVDLRKTPSGVAQLQFAAELAKRSLALRRQTSVVIAYGSKSYEVTVTADAYRQGTLPLIARVNKLASEVLAKAETYWTRLAHVLLIGGASQTPTLKDLIRERTGRVPEQRVHPEEAIARGAALYASYLLQSSPGKSDVRPAAVSNICTQGLGVTCVDPLTQKSVNRVMIPPGAALPASATHEFVACISPQRSVAISIVEGTSPDPAKCVPIGHAVLRELPADITTRWPVEVSFQFSANGILSIDARLRYTDHNVHLTVVRTGDTSRTQIDRWKEVLNREVGFADVQATAAHEKVDRTRPPVIIASSPSGPAAEPESSLLGFARRCLPSAFSKVSETPPTVDAATGAEGLDGYLMLTPVEASSAHRGTATR